MKRDGRRERRRVQALEKLAKNEPSTTSATTCVGTPSPGTSRLPPTVKMPALEVQRLKTIARDLDLAPAPYPVFVVGNDGCIEDANFVAESLVGYPRRELVGTLMDLVISRFSSSLSTAHRKLVIRLA